jgi:hypothetical protein
LTILLLLALVFWGIPSLIKLAIFLGDIRSSSQPISGRDSIPPPPPILQPLPNATSSATLEIEGIAEEGSTVVLTVNGSVVQETVVESDGEFLFNEVRLKTGENEIFAKAIDEAGNESQNSIRYKIYIDNQAPQLTVTFPQSGDSFYGQAEKSLNVSGQAELGSLVRVNGSLAILDQEGNFSFPISLTGGENKIVVTATDKAGNQTTEEINVNYEE